MASVMSVLQSCKAAEIQNLVKQLSIDEVDILVKYVYRGMQYPDKYPPATLLSWHERVLEVGGHGCVVRVMTDRKTV